MFFRQLPMQRLLIVLTAAGLMACGGDEPAAEGEAPVGQQTAAETAPPSAAQELQMPGWMQVDSAAETVSMEVVAGETRENNGWNFNGYTNGEATVVVPAGYSVEITFRNDDQALAHSLGIDEVQQNWPTTFQNPEPVFEGAITSNPTDLTAATQPGQTETITFTADEAGEYAMVCYIAGHAVTGMWIYFTVSDEGEAGLRAG